MRNIKSIFYFCEIVEYVCNNGRFNAECVIDITTKSAVPKKHSDKGITQIHASSERSTMKNAVISGISQVSILKCIVVSLGMTVLVFLGSMETLLRAFGQSDLLPSGYVGTFMSNALDQDAVVSLIPILAVIPFSGVYVDDLKSKFARFFLIRCSYSDYIISRILITFFCSGGCIAFGGLSAWIISALLFMPMELTGEVDWVIISTVVQKLILMLCNGGLWAVIGISMSSLMESKYVAYASPFVIYYFLVILCERYISDSYLLYPPNWTNPNKWPYGAWGAAIFLIELTMVFSILFVNRAGRRLREL